MSIMKGDGEICMLPEQAYVEFKEIYEKNFNKKITLEEAKDMADNFFGVLTTICDDLKSRDSSVSYKLTNVVK